MVASLEVVCALFPDPPCQNGSTTSTWTAQASCSSLPVRLPLLVLLLLLLLWVISAWVRGMRISQRPLESTMICGELGKQHEA